MAKKIFKLLIWAVIIYGAVAGGIILLNKYKDKNLKEDPDDSADDYNGFTIDDITEEISEREYVTIPTDHPVDKAKEA